MVHHKGFCILKNVFLTLLVTLPIQNQPYVRSASSHLWHYFPMATEPSILEHLQLMQVMQVYSLLKNKMGHPVSIDLFTLLMTWKWCKGEPDGMASKQWVVSSTAFFPFPAPAQTSVAESDT